jgi:hypothetical protein
VIARSGPYCLEAVAMLAHGPRTFAFPSVGCPPPVTSNRSSPNFPTRGRNRRG